jgi:hypothetical protein
MIMDGRLRGGMRRITVGLALLQLLWFAGCIQMAANLLHVVNGPRVPAEFKGLDNHRVAVVCSNEMGICRDESTIRLAGNIKGILISKLPKATFVSQEEIDQWVEGSSVSDDDLTAIGKGVKADYVLAVDMQKLQLRDGPTLYRGRSDLTLSVWDVQQNKPVFRKSLPDYSYPTMAGQSTTETDEDKFRRVYLVNVADRLARCFYAHDFGEDVAVDATILKQ